MVFNPVPGDTQLCIFCMSLLFNTPDSDHQLIRREIMNCMCVSDKRYIQNVQSGGSPGQGLKTTELKHIKWKVTFNYNTYFCLKCLV